MWAWLTPDEISTNTVCRVLVIPDTVDIIAAVSGALEPLTKEENWEQFGVVEPATIAYRMELMLNDYLNSQGRCVPIGGVIYWAGSTIPDGYLECDGSQVLQADYPQLYSEIADVWGSADVGFFRLPDLRGRATVAVGQGSGLTLRELADTGGEEAHTLVEDEIPSHSHTTQPHDHTEIAAVAVLINGGLEAPASSAVPSASVTGTAGVTVNDTGGDEAHNNMQPFVCLKAIIRAL